jgi:acetyl-CoA carboxylase carboxyltransferase component
MNGRAYEPELIVVARAPRSPRCQPTAVEIVFGRPVDAAQNPSARRSDRPLPRATDVCVAARNAMIGDVVDPPETRRAVARALRVAERKRVQRPWKRHGVISV